MNETDFALITESHLALNITLNKHTSAAFSQSHESYVLKSDARFICLDPTQILLHQCNVLSVAWFCIVLFAAFNHFCHVSLAKEASNLIGTYLVKQRSDRYEVCTSKHN